METLFHIGETFRKGVALFRLSYGFGLSDTGYFGGHATLDHDLG